jgi:hypothetical protein
MGSGVEEGHKGGEAENYLTGIGECSVCCAHSDTLDFVRSIGGERCFNLVRSNVYSCRSEGGEVALLGVLPRAVSRW